MPTRKARGARTQDLARDFMREHGWPECEDVAASVSGADLLKLLGLAVEVKGRKGFSPLEWIRQARKNARPGELPVVVLRPDGLGERSVHEWVTVLRFGDFVGLLREANYAPEPSTCQTCQTRPDHNAERPASPAMPEHTLPPRGGYVPVESITGPFELHPLEEVAAEFGVDLDDDEEIPA